MDPALLNAMLEVAGDDDDDMRYQIPALASGGGRSGQDACQEDHAQARGQVRQAAKHAAARREGQLIQEAKLHELRNARAYNGGLPRGSPRHLRATML